MNRLQATIGLLVALTMTATSCAVAPVLILVVGSSGGPGYDDLVREVRRLGIQVNRPGQWTVRVNNVDMRGKYRVASGQKRPWAIKARVTFTACPVETPDRSACFTRTMERMYLFRQVRGRWHCFRSESARGWVVKQDNSLPNPVQTLRELR
jgi:hypothetical protein